MKFTSSPQLALMYRNWYIIKQRNRIGLLPTPWMQATYKIVDFGISKMFKNTDNGNAESAMVLIDPAFYVFYLSDEFVEFYCLSGVKLHLLSHGFVRVRPYLRGLVHSPPRIEWQPYFGVSTQVSVYGRQSKIHFRARGTCRSYSLIRIAINEGH
ncbi:hypothetical protein MTR_6g091590 [Medicago truncatula]|uniref:Protein kinase domain-containing protein n=1 Tax=Medicago truncatula TaxID=3880 RepID=G7KIP7_MEDTR|nr:hypothetical protein MTR_6g091590 [Medicago truncatula]